MKQEKNTEQSRYYFGEEVQMLDHQNLKKLMQGIQVTTQNTRN